jgi:hypothetical protein
MLGCRPAADGEMPTPGKSLMRPVPTCPMHVAYRCGVVVHGSRRPKLCSGGHDRRWRRMMAILLLHRPYGVITLKPGTPDDMPATTGSTRRRPSWTVKNTSSCCAAAAGWRRRRSSSCAPAAVCARRRIARRQSSIPLSRLRFRLRLGAWARAIAMVAAIPSAATCHSS